MRASPDGLRSVVLDSVAPMQVPIYDTLELPHAEAIQGIFDACTADAKCAAASGTGLVNECEAALEDRRSGAARPSRPGRFCRR